jgi:DnaJ-class molecular chaperone
MAMSEAGASFEMIPVDKCDACDGDGWVHVWSQDGMSVVADRDCDECSGTGDANAERSPSW